MTVVERLVDWRIWAALTAACLLIGLLSTKALQAYALRSGWLDIPNARSSHSVPTPRSGGIAIWIAFTAGISVLLAFELLDWRLYVALAGGGTAVAAVGYVDDRTQLSARSRLLVHVTAAVWALAWMGKLPAIGFFGAPVDLGAAGYVLGVLAIVWTVNLFNFMDGIDGLAGAQAVFMAMTGAALALLAGGASIALAAALLAASCAGFLVWNWPPARIFMGDVGSGFVGFAIAVLALASAQVSAVGPVCWLVLGGVFFVDATLTLVRRVGRGLPASQPHRDHAYQTLTRRWHSHLRVTLCVAVVNVLWLAPGAFMALRHPAWAGVIALAALLPLAALVLVITRPSEARSSS